MGVCKVKVEKMGGKREEQAILTVYLMMEFRQAVSVSVSV